MKIDLLTFGRASIDLYSKNIGAAFIDIKELSTSIGGSPVNIAVGAQRLGLKTAVLTAVGPDPVGDFIINTLDNEGVNTQYIPTIAGTTSTAVICGIIPPDTFPLVFYRDNAPDKKITIDHVKKIDFENIKSILITGTALSVEPSRSAVFYAVELAKKQGIPVFLDIDFRVIAWEDIRTFGITLKQLLPLCDVVIGTEEELLMIDLQDTKQLTIKNNSITAPEIKGSIEKVVKMVLNTGIKMLLVKTGSKGVSLYHQKGAIEHVAGFEVEVTNILGAGDAFASGFIYGYLNGWNTYRTARLANACGAWLVTKQGCCNYAPYYDEIIDFIENKGGF